jgi:UDP-glucuronate 4-epimerase
MAYWKFADAITKGEPVYLHDGGSVTRDFTYIDDIVDGIMLLMYSFAPDHTSTVYNIGSQNPYSVSTLLSLIEKELCKRATTISVPLPAGMAKHTCADNWKLHTATDFIARTSLADGIKRFVNWYKKYHEKGK